MFTRSVLILAGLLALAGCTEKPVGSAHHASAALSGQVMALSHGTITGVRYITIQNDTGSSAAGTVGRYRCWRDGRTVDTTRNGAT